MEKLVDFPPTSFDYPDRLIKQYYCTSFALLQAANQLAADHHILATTGWSMGKERGVAHLTKRRFENTCQAEAAQNAMP